MLHDEYRLAGTVAALFWVFVLTFGLGPAAAQSLNPVEVVGDPETGLEVVIDPRTRQPVESWRVLRDNPVVGGDFRLPWGPDIDPGFQRVNGFAWLYDFFDLEVAFVDEGPYRFRGSWPQTPGAGSTSNTPEMRWESHGLLLDPKGSPAEIELFEEDWQNPSLNWVDGYVHLDPKVKVVPVKAIVLFGPGNTNPASGITYSALSATRITQEDMELLFDDHWLLQKSLNSSPGYSPEQVISSWTHRPGCGVGTTNCQAGKVADIDALGLPGRFLQPDRVFESCQVQFRQVSFHTCGVLGTELYRVGIDCEGYGVDTVISTAIQEHCPEIDLYDGSIPVVFTGRLNDDKCPGGFLFGAEKGGMVMVAEHAPANVVPHEIGHALGLGAGNTHVSGDCSSPSGNLMCPGGHRQLYELYPDQCATAYSVAETKHQGFW